RNDWGYDTADVPLSAGGITGSPYHMRLITWNLNNLGNQDRSLKASAVIPPPECDLAGPENVCSGEENIEYTVSAINAFEETYSWVIKDNTSGASFVTEPGDTSTSAYINAGTAGSFTVEVTILSPFGSTTCDITTTVDPEPTAVA